MVMISIVDSIKHLAWAAGIKRKIRRWLHTKHMKKLETCFLAVRFIMLSLKFKEVATMPFLRILCALQLMYMSIVITVPSENNTTILACKTNKSGK